MKDFLGNELSVNDSVLFIAPGYRLWAKGKILSFTKLKVKISYSNTWNHSLPGYPCELLQDPIQLVKVP